MPTRDQVLHQMSLDTKTLAALQARGDDPESTHSVEHHVYSAMRPALTELLRVARLLAFAPSSITAAQDSDGAAYFHADLVIDTPLAPDWVTRDALLVLSLAEAFGCSYDGWGTLVATPSDSSEPTSS